MIWRCVTCNKRFSSWAAAQRHAYGHGGARVELVLSERVEPVIRRGR